MRTNYLRTAATLFCALYFVACATIEIDLPSVAEQPGGDRMPGKIVWRDLLTHDRMIDTVAMNGRDDISQWIVAMSVADIDAAVARFAAAGSEIVTSPTDLQRRGRLAVVRDPEGALLALLQTRDGDPADSEPEIDGFLWDELWTTDIDKATELYGSVAGLQADEWDVDQDQTSNITYRLLKSGEKPRVGIMPNPLEGLSPVWVSYLRVNSPADVAAKVDVLGGRIIVEAQARQLGGEVAFVAGPSGAGIALQTWPLEQKD
jgi:predicted enzyme related to lactoylglutathione lyase